MLNKWIFPGNVGIWLTVNPYSVIAAPPNQKLCVSAALR